MSAITYGFLHTQSNTPLYTERLIVYNLIFGIDVTSYFLVPGLTVQWIAGMGWQYVTLPLDLMLIDQIIFIPIIELAIHAIRRLRSPFRIPESRRTVLIFFFGLSFVIISNVISYFTNLLYYWGLTIGIALMGLAFVRNPLVLNITHVKIYDLVMSVNAVAVARYNFEKKEAIRSEHLLSGAFSSISSLAGETISTKKELTLLQTEDKTVLMHRFVDDYYQQRNEIFNVEIDPVLFEKEVCKIFTFA